MKFYQRELETLTTDFQQYASSLYTMMKNKQSTGLMKGLPEWIAASRMSKEQFAEWALTLFLRFRNQTPGQELSFIKHMVVLGGAAHPIHGNPMVWGEINDCHFDALRNTVHDKHIWVSPVRDILVPEDQKKFDLYCSAGYIAFTHDWEGQKP